jgi:Family of unknown function (DUF6502)
MSSTAANAAASASPDIARQGALFSLRWLLRRLVRLALSFGVTYPMLDALVKRCYVESATEDFPLPGKESTLTRIALLTGLNRSDLRRLDLARSEQQTLPDSVEWRVAMRWLERPFVDTAGQPLRLHRLASQGGEMSFEALVAAISTDIHAGALLSEWVHAGVAQLNDEHVALDLAKFLARLRQTEQPLRMLAYIVGDLLQVHVQHMADPTRKRGLVRANWLTGLTPDSVRQLDVAANKILESSRELEALGTRLQAKDAGMPEAHMRYMYVTFRYHADADEDPAFPLEG